MSYIDASVANFPDSVKFFSDKSRQRFVWIDENKKESSFISLGELYCQFFDDNNINQFIKDGFHGATLTNDQKVAVIKFRDALERFSKAPGPHTAPINYEELMIDVEWNEIVRLAQSTLLVFPE